MNTNKGELFRSAASHTLPVMTGYIVLGAGFGVILSGIGLGSAWAAFMAAAIYAGSMQYLAVELLAGAFSPLYAFIITLIVNARHIFYGISFLEKYKQTGKLKPYLIFGLTDETFAVLSSAEISGGIPPASFYFLVTLLNHSYWVIGCTLGSIIGQNLPFDTSDVAFSMTAMFTAAFTSRMMNKEDRLPGILGLAVTAFCLFIFGADSFLLPAMAALILCFAILRRTLRTGGKAA